MYVCMYICNVPVMVQKQGFPYTLHPKPLLHVSGGLSQSDGLVLSCSETESSGFRASQASCAEFLLYPLSWDVPPYTASNSP